VNPDRWRLLAGILERAWDLSPERREELLARETDGDPVLRAEIDSLLAAEAEAGSFLEHAAAEQLEPSRCAGGDELASGTRIGPYAVSTRLGRGGMGEVYLAERVDGQFRQSVALKLIRRGMDSAEIIQRFLSERQILARLVHPHIARLLDGGTAPDGRPWFALEYVEGLPISRFVAERAIGLEARLDLFEQVADAVRYAHQNLVVHRDLKPSNVLVTADGEVKLLDFGIAKVIQGAGGEGTTLTSRGEWLLTPEYGAPEQVRGEPVTTATDVYALGAVLYELLTGQRAHKVSDLTPMEMVRAVCEDVPAPPSAVAAPEQRRRLRGDLDTIILKALAKEPGRRYPSAEALLEDLRRHRAGLPVHARPDSALYRARKFVRRHRLAVATTGAVALALAGGIGATLRQSYATRREADKAARAKAVLVSVLETSITMQPGQQVIYPRELLQQGVVQVDSAFAAEPSMRQELFADLARIHHHLGYLLEADSLLVRAVTAARQAYGSGSPIVASRLTELARVRTDQGEYGAASLLLGEALAIYPARERGLHVDELARLLGYAGRLVAAESVLRAAAHQQQGFGGGSPLDLARIFGRLGEVLETRGNLPAADTAWTAALRVLPETVPADSVRLAALDGLALVRERRADLAEAERLRRQLLVLRRQGNDPVETAAAAGALARVLESRGSLGEAESLLEQALQLETRHLRAEHPATLRTASDLALIAYRLGKRDEAEAAMRRILTVARRAAGATDPVSLTVAHNLGGMLAERGRTGEAAPLLREAWAGRERMFGKNAIEPAQTVRLLGVLAHRSGDLAAADSLLGRAFAAYRSAYPPGHPRLADALLSLGELRLDEGRRDEGLGLLREALTLRRNALGQADPRTGAAERAVQLAEARPVPAAR
jgi:serine/threonine-protein kinase